MWSTFVEVSFATWFWCERIFRTNVCTFFFAGLMSGFPSYLRTFQPRKSKSASIRAILVSSWDRVSPRSYMDSSGVASSDGQGAMLACVLISGLLTRSVDCPLARQVNSRTGFSNSQTAVPKKDGAECTGAGLT